MFDVITIRTMVACKKWNNYSEKKARKTRL